MSNISNIDDYRSNQNFYNDRVDMACAFRWAARYNWHEAVANHFSLAVGDDNTQILLNPRHRYFPSIKASDLLLLDVNDADILTKKNAPDVTAWWLHGTLHKYNPQIKCVMHVHSIYATVLATLADSTLPPIDQNTALFYNRYIIDNHFGGLALKEEGARCANAFKETSHKVMIMGNHGVLVVGSSVADTFERLYYFERAAQTYITALSTGKELRVLPHDIAEKTAREFENYNDNTAEAFFRDLQEILDIEEPNYRH